MRVLILHTAPNGSKRAASILRTTAKRPRMTEIEVDVVIPPPRPVMGRKLPRRESAILLIATSERRLGDTNIKTGAWAETLAEPYYTFRKKGYAVAFASVAGGPIPIDPYSLSPPIMKNHVIKSFMYDKEAQYAMSKSLPVAIADPDEYVAIFIAGGHGIAWDGPFNPELRRLIEDAYKQRKLIAAVDHGPAALVHAINRREEDPDYGAPILARKQVTAISDSEEEAMGRADLVPFLLEDRIRAIDGIYVRSLRDWDTFAVRTSQIITGQNAASSKETADAVVDALSFGVRLTP